MLGTLVAGYYQANASLYRFAAAELVAPAARDKAISWVLAGGIIGAVIGPNLAAATRDLLPQPFTAAYLSLVGRGAARAGADSLHPISADAPRRRRPPADDRCARSRASRCSSSRSLRRRSATA